jgi:hypothetical protein
VKRPFVDIRVRSIFPFRFDWLMTAEEDVWPIAEYLVDIPHTPILLPNDSPAECTPISDCSNPRWWGIGTESNQRGNTSHAVGAVYDRARSLICGPCAVIDRAYSRSRSNVLSGCGVRRNRLSIRRHWKVLDEFEFPSAS